jgi:membrane-bound lytic murein transglycosylase D
MSTQRGKILALTAGMFTVAKAKIRQSSAWTTLVALGAAALVPVLPAIAAYQHPVTWEDMSSMDLRPAFRSQYSSLDNLFEGMVTPSDLDLVMRDADARISEQFHIPPALKPTAAFWLNIYTLYTTQHVVIYDAHHPELVYDVLDFRELARTARNKIVYEIVSKKRIAKAVEAYRNALSRLVRNPRPKKPSVEEQNILAAVRRLPHKHSFSQLRAQLRTQTGQRDNIIKGLLAAETFFPKMEQIFLKMGVPIELTRLTLVESSFNLNATSKVGASGVWQFMPRSGKEFLVMDDRANIDERRSPLKSTVAAAKLLKRNRKQLGHWALGVIAFNHGGRGLPRLNDKKDDFDDIAHLFDPCNNKVRKSSRLGYASRNYYAEYLAVLHAEAYRHLFYGKAPTSLVQAITFHKVKPGKTAMQVAMEHGIGIQQFKLYNPDIMNLRSRLPRGFLVAIPGENDDLAMLTDNKRRASGTPNSTSI